MKNIITHKSGFSLLEVLLSGVIIIIVLSSLIVIGRNTIDNGSSLQSRLQATYLAQEGIELTRQIRDTNYLDGDNATSWKKLVYKDNSFMEPLDKEYGISFDQSKKRYVLKDSSDTVTINGTIFTRKITFENSQGSFELFPINLGDVELDSSDINKQAIKVVVKISWEDKKAQKNITLEELITNSRQVF